MSSDDAHGRFVCPDCRGTISTDPQIRRALVRHGCVLCGTGITPEAFPRTETDSDVENRV